MNRKHEKTLSALFQQPVNHNIQWRAVVSMMRALGANVEEAREGSRVAFILDDDKFLTHKPHPEKTLGADAIKHLRLFLTHHDIRPR